MNGGTVTFHFKGDSKQLDSTMGSLTKNITMGNLLAKGIGKVFGAVSNSMDGAISRLDTMNNFPKVMSNLGIDAKESKASIDKLSKGLQNVPTTLDEAALAVQRFTSVNSDVKKSTDIFLAVNDAILAGGASSQIQSSALEQLSQAYSKGKPDMMEWRTIQMAMPAQLKQVAIAMGYAGGNTAQLGEDLRSGNVSMDAFINTIMKLDKEGVNGFQSFSKQAENSVGGIKTNLTNMHTAISRGIANTIQSFNDAMTKAKLPTVQKMIQIITQKINSAFKAVQSFISKVNWGAVFKTIKVLIPVVTVLFSAFMAYKAVTGVLNAVAVAQALLNTVMLLNPVGLVIAGIVGLITALVLVYKKCEWFRNVVNAIFKGIIVFFKASWQGLKIFIMAPFIIFNVIKSKAEGFKTTIHNVFNKIIDFFKNNWKTIGAFLINPLWGAFVLLYQKCTWFRNAVNKVFNAIVSFIKSVPGKVKAVPGQIINFFKSLPSKMLNIGINMVKGLVNGIRNAKQMAINAVKNLGGKILGGIKNVLGIHSPSTEFAMIARF